MNIMLSVDWDFFFDERRYDWGHREAPFFQDAMWSIRLYGNPELEREYTPRNYSDFWPKLRSLGVKPNAFFVSDSHTFAYETAMLLGQVDLIVHFDAHADMNTKDVDFVDCENWLYRVMLARPKLKVVWICPDRYGLMKDYLRFPYLPLSVKERFHSHTACQLHDVARHYAFKGAKYLLGYIARSGAWTPPWADVDFHKFCVLSGAKLLDMVNHDYIKYREYQRPTPEQVRAMHEQTARLMREFNQRRGET